ncbi:unnamed protein product [Cylindrotheca closterium]|uniref:Uncharacterized protein n=1 Tax=Cylindrotheca closterium TaxID=2856 RepID=A0AAD2JLL2_9STRA|nr:unnamed protein product [Cylindrotheca closterium]
MNTQTNRSTNQINKVFDTISDSFCNLALLSMASNYIEKKETSENTYCINRSKRMKLWHQPSAHGCLKGRKRTKTCSKRAKLSFSEEVKVYEIPSRHEYSSQDKSRIWRGRKEIKMNAKRNHVEFYTEGEDWRKVVEEDDMYVDEETGQLIHPCWVDDDEEDSFDDEYSSDYEETASC